MAATRTKTKPKAEPKPEPKPPVTGDAPTADEYDPTVHANHSHLNP